MLRWNPCEWMRGQQSGCTLFGTSAGLLIILLCRAESGPRVPCHAHAGGTAFSDWWHVHEGNGFSSSYDLWITPHSAMFSVHYRRCVIKVWVGSLEWSDHSVGVYPSLSSRNQRTRGNPPKTTGAPIGHLLSFTMGPWGWEVVTGWQDWDRMKGDSWVYATSQVVHLATSILH